MGDDGLTTSFVLDWWIIVSRRLDAAGVLTIGGEEINLSLTDESDEESDSIRLRLIGEVLTNFSIFGRCSLFVVDRWVSTRGAGV